MSKTVHNTICKSYTKRAGFVLCSILCLLLSACQSFGVKKPEAPEISVAAIKPKSLGLQSQRFIFTLKAQNKNAYDIPINGVKFNTLINDVDIAKGTSDQAFSLRANDITEFDIEVSMQLIKSVQDAVKVLAAQGLSFDYKLEGELDVAKSPLDIPFTIQGNILDSL